MAVLKVYNEATGKWEFVDTVSTGIIPSSVPLVNPKHDQLWLDTSDNDFQGSAINAKLDGIESNLTLVDSDLSAHKAVSATTSVKGHVQLSSSLTSTSTTLGATASAVKSLKDSLDNLWKTIYPVGCLFETTSSTFNPQTHFGGTWSQYGAGRVTVGYSSGETEFNTGGKTGGAKTHKLTETQMPYHSHNVSATGTSDGTLNHAGAYIAACDGSALGWSRATGGSGGTEAHNNLQPYITVFRWRRTA